VDVRFEAPVAPPAEIHLTSKFVRAVGPLQQFNVEAMANGQVVARGQITLHRTAAPPASPASAMGGGAA
jgi:3-hydroxymyristoyl/3-hydroxydecanoyl-(acyl carrier protein) dehydratase